MHITLSPVLAGAGAGVVCGMGISAGWERAARLQQSQGGAEDKAVMSCHSWNYQVAEKQSSSERAEL